jgi:hypothetical protein
VEPSGEAVQRRSPMRKKADACGAEAGEEEGQAG